MDKATELARLDSFIATLPDDTYLKPWLRQVRGEIETLIRGDIIPYVSLKDARDQVTTMLAEAHAGISRTEENAKRHAQSIIESAKTEAAKIEKSCSTHIEYIRREFNDDVIRLRKVLNNIAAA